MLVDTLLSVVSNNSLNFKADFIKTWNCLWISILTKTAYSKIFENIKCASAIYLEYMGDIN